MCWNSNLCGERQRRGTGSSGRLCELAAWHWLHVRKRSILWLKLNACS